MAYSQSFMNAVAPYGAGTAKEYAVNMSNKLMDGPAGFAGTMGNMYNSYNQGYGSYNQGLASLGDSYAKNYGALAGGVGQIAQGLGNTWNNAQSNAAGTSAAEAARQMAVANLGTAAMTSYGGVAGQGLQAWAQNQNGYQRALAELGSANQMATSQLGVGRYNALAGLGKAGAAMDVGRNVAGALPALAGGSGASGGGYGGGGYGGGGYDMLNAVRGDIGSGRELASLDQNFGRGMNSLDADQALARNMPRTMVGDAYTALRDLNSLNLDASSRGMDQFYDNYRMTLQPGREGQAIPTGSLLESLAGGYSDSAQRISGAQKAMTTGWGDASRAYGTSVDGVRSLYDASVGKLFRSPLEDAQDQWALQDATRERTNMLTQVNAAQAALSRDNDAQRFRQWQAANPAEARFQAAGGWRRV